MGLQQHTAQAPLYHQIFARRLQQHQDCIQVGVLVGHMVCQAEALLHDHCAGRAVNALKGDSDNQARLFTDQQESQDDFAQQMKDHAASSGASDHPQSSTSITAGISSSLPQVAMQPDQKQDHAPAKQVRFQAPLSKGPLQSVDQLIHVHSCRWVLLISVVHSLSDWYPYWYCDQADSVISLGKIQKCSVSGPVQD